MDINARMELFNTYLDHTGLDHKDYQQDGVKWCLNNELREDPPHKVRGGFIADEMGLGKTILMIGTMVANLVTSTLIVLPPVLLDQWYLQILRTTGHKAFIYHGQTKKTTTLEQLEQKLIVLTTYGAISLTNKQLTDKELTPLHQVSWGRIIFDEAHHLRNKKTALHMSAKLLRAQIRWLVSGTPVQNKKQDLHNLCSVLGLPNSFSVNQDNSNLLARDFILKRTKKQVGILLPELHIDSHVVEWTNQKEKDLSEEIHSELAFSRVSGSKSGRFCDSLSSENEKGRVLALLIKAKQSCVMPKLMTASLDKLVKAGLFPDSEAYKEALSKSSKLDFVVSSLLERKDNGCGKLVFCNYRQEIDVIAARLRSGGMNVATFDGRTSQSMRHEILSQKNDALILQIQTGCEGLNLQDNYSEIYFVSPHWNPSVEDQAIARCHRIGQTKPVYVKRFEMAKFDRDEGQTMDTVTIDSYVSTVQDKKRVITAECINVE
jgi:SNF2 family DNA or RNA helicase